MDATQQQIREQQKQSWNKFSPGWKKWDGLLMEFLRPMGDVMIEKLKIREGDHVLDIAAGTGEPGLTIAAIAKKGTVTGTDLSEEMLKIAEDKAAGRGLKNYSTMVTDAGELPFSDHSFTVVSCRMGFMYFPDMKLALDEMYRVLKPGGRIATAVWTGPDQNFWIMGLMGIVNKYVELPPPPPGSPGMFRCAAPGLMAGLFASSGFKNIKEQNIRGKADYVDSKTYWQHMKDCAAPVIALMEKSDTPTKEAIANDVLKLIDANSTNGKALLDFGANIIYAEK